MLLDRQHIHLTGIGGIGMSGLALIILDMGYKVSGSDVKLSDITARLERKGAKIFKGHSASSLPQEAGALVYSSSVAKNNPELLEARKRGLPVAQRAELLGEILNRKTGIAVTGTHGKTTTTSLISVILEKCSLDPTVIIGGEVSLFGGNAKLGKGPYVVAEADESDGSFLRLKPFYSIITNIEMEHMDYYKSLEDVMKAYSGFAKNLKPGGKILYNHEDRNIIRTLKGLGVQKESFGFSKEGSIYPVEIKMDEFNTRFRCVYRDTALGTVELKIPGLHNVLNALAAILLGLNMDIAFADIVKAIKDFTGTKRRFHLRADAGGVMLIDDYAHHPTEIKAVLDACRNWKRKRIIAVFQPHRYSRTLFLADDFGRCFAGADKVILTDIYAASEDPIEGVSVETLYEKIRHSGHKDVMILKKRDIVDHVMSVKKKGDMILILGAGDIKDVADALSDALAKKKAVS
jgi:UDP-N-acetylmuramate--alanine ligase